jgi:hypothetical protein
MTKMAFTGDPVHHDPIAGISETIAGKPLGSVTDRDEFLHPPAPSGHYSSTETSYFGFNIPAAALNAEIYMWFHPVLRLMSASVYIWRGLKSSTLACEYINHYHYLPMPEGDIDDYEIEALGLKIRIIKPLHEAQLSFLDKERGVSFSLRLVAIMPPGVRPGSYHFTQAMKTSGELDLFGQKYTIDGFWSRDHSWGQERRETSRLLPPLAWTVGIFDADFAFHVMAFDSPELKPTWVSRYDMPAGSNFLWGFVRRDGETYPLVSARQLTTREPDGLSPRSVELELADAGGQTHALRGYANARMPWQTWQNLNVWFCQMRWEGRRGVGWGDFQDCQQNDFVSHFGR